MIPMPLTTLQKGFKRIVQRAGLKECTIHSLRHPQINKIIDTFDRYIEIGAKSGANL